MTKLAKDVIQGDVLKVHWGVVPYPTNHKVVSVVQNGERTEILLKTSYGTEKLIYDNDEFVEVVCNGTD